MREFCSSVFHHHVPNQCKNDKPMPNQFLLEITNTIRNYYFLVKLEELTEYFVEWKIDPWQNEAISLLKNKKVLDPSIFLALITSSNV